jgi:hypothetical protein
VSDRELANEMQEGVLREEPLFFVGSARVKKIWTGFIFNDKNSVYYYRENGYVGGERERRFEPTTPQ